MGVIDLFNYTFAIYSAPSGPIEVVRQEAIFLGSACIISSSGTIATCAHVVEKVIDGHKLYITNPNAPKPHGYELIDIKIHPSMDFAVGKIKIINSPFFYPYQNQPIIGLDVNVHGYMNPEKNNGNFSVLPRFMKGYISRRHDKPPPVGRRAITTCELSFPSYNGLSGSAVFIEDQGIRIVGMLFDNLKSHIEDSSYIEIKEDGTTYSEKQLNIVNHGLMHTINDIKKFLDEMKIIAFL